MINFSARFPTRPMAALLSFATVMVFVVGITNSGFAAPMPRMGALTVYAPAPWETPALKNGYAKNPTGPRTQELGHGNFFGYFSGPTTPKEPWWPWNR
jgi:hypothetical protein